MPEPAGPEQATPVRGAADASDFSVRVGGKPANPMEAIVPVFRLDAASRLHVLGTGFLISRLGIFASAKHVFMDVVDANDQPCDGLAIMQFADNNAFHSRTVSGFAVHDKADVGVGVCHPMRHKRSGEPLFNRAVTLSRRRPQVGDQVWTYAYAGTRVEGIEPQHITVNPSFFMGVIQQAFPNGRDSLMLPAPCWETSIVLHGGTSGGPVFGYGGRVVGINSTGIEGDLDVSFISRIEDLFPLGIPDVQLPEESAPRRVTIGELVRLNYVALR